MRNPFRRLSKLSFRERTDEDWVAGVRRNVAFIERWRWWMIGASVGIGVLYFELLLPAIAQSFVTGPMPAAATWQITRAFVSGVVAGFGLAMPLGLGLVTWGAAIMPLRTERLLLKYHDALQAREIALSHEEHAHT